MTPLENHRRRKAVLTPVHRLVMIDALAWWTNSVNANHFLALVARDAVQMLLRHPADSNINLDVDESWIDIISSMLANYIELEEGNMSSLQLKAAEEATKTLLASHELQADVEIETVTLTVIELQ